MNNNLKCIHNIMPSTIIALVQANKANSTFQTKAILLKMAQ